MAKGFKEEGDIERTVKWKYIWYVNDLDSLIVEYEKRINRKKPYPTEWEHGAANEYNSYLSAQYTTTNRISR